MASRCATRGSTRHAARLEPRLEPVEHLREERVAHPREPHALQRGVEPGAELVPLAAVERVHARVRRARAARRPGWRARSARQNSSAAGAPGGMARQGTLRDRAVRRSTCASTLRCPAELAVGAGTAVFVAGTCLAPRCARRRARARSSTASEQPVMAHGMPRHRRAARARRGDRVPQRLLGDGAARPAPRPRAARARAARAARRRRGRRGRARPDRRRARCPAPLDAGAPEVVDLHGDVRAAAGAARAPARLDPRADAPGLAVRDLRRLLVGGGLRRRSRRRSADDPRFVVSRAPRRLGFYRNFERALALAPRRRALRRARRPGRRLAPGQARDAGRRRSATRGSSTATRA